MQKNTKALLVFFSIVGAMIVILLVLIFFNINSGNIKFIFKVFTDKSEKTIQIQKPKNIYFRPGEDGLKSVNSDFAVKLGKGDLYPCCLQKKWPKPSSR